MCIKFFFIFIYSVDNSNGTNLNTTDNPGYKILQNATYTPINDTFEFPKCRRKCSSFYIGRSDFTVVNDSIEYRAGDFAEFACDEGYYIEGSVRVRTMYDFHDSSETLKF